jgi:hypothetical protein
MTRSEHLQWAKDRALQYCDAGDTTNAFASIQSDMGKHPELERHMALEMGTMLLIGGHLSTPAQMRDWITGFN